MTKFWGVFNKTKNTIYTTTKGTPVILSTRTAAQEIVRNDKKNLKVVRVDLNLQHRNGEGKWVAFS